MNIEWLLIGLIGVLFAVWLIGRRCVAKAREDRIVGWARVSLLGRVEFVGAVREVERHGATWIEVLTADGRTMRTQPGVVYTLERLPFGTVEEEVVRAVERRNREEKTLRDQRDHARDEVDARDARIDNLRKALAVVHANLVAMKPESDSAIDNLKMNIEAELDADTAEECPF